MEQQQQKEEVKEKLKCTVALLGTSGSGKSTTIGHLLYLHKVFDQKTFKIMEKQSEQIGKASFKFQFLVNNRKSQRQRSMTLNNHIHVLDTRSHIFTFIDNPGSKGYQKTTICGSSQADLGLVIISTNDSKTQSQRDQLFKKSGLLMSQIANASILGIKSFIFCVNIYKGFDVNQQVFKQIKTIVSQYITGYLKIKLNYLQFIPISAYEGFNLLSKGNFYLHDQNIHYIDKVFQWSDAPCLTQALLKFKKPPIRYKLEKRSLRMSVRTVYKISGVGTVPVGRILSGTMKPGMQLLIQPGNIKTELKSIQENRQLLNSAKVGDNVGINIKGVSVRNIQRGAIISQNTDDFAKCPSNFLVKLNIIKGKIKQGYAPQMHCMTGQVSCVFAKFQSKQKIGQTSKVIFYPKTIYGGDCANVVVKPMKPIVVQSYNDFPYLGRLIFRDMNQTVAFGRVIQTDIKVEESNASAQRSEKLKKILGEISQNYLCPISQEVMQDPVLTEDGHTYERECIQDWLKYRNTSPLTNIKLSSKKLIPNIALRKLIIELEHSAELLNKEI